MTTLYEAHFVLHDHRVTVTYYRDGERTIPTGKVICATSSLSYVMVEAARFATTHNVRALVIDGAELRRIN